MASLRLLAKIKRLSQNFDQAQFNGNIDICAFLNQTVNQECTPQFAGLLTSMVSEVSASMVTVNCCPGLGGSGETLRELIVTTSLGSPT